MRIWSGILSLSATALLACSRNAEQQFPLNADQPSRSVANASQPPNGPLLPDSAPPTPLEEPKGPIDPKSIEAAGQVAQRYGALIEQGRFAEAEKHWGDANVARRFAAGLKLYREVHLEIGDLGEPEGAAGSTFVTMPVVFYGKQSNGTVFRRPAGITLRRVNDVPGSTESQRHWHIERIDWAAT